MTRVLRQKMAEQAAAREAQRRSFAYGNTKLSNPAITREMVNAAAEKIRNEPVDVEMRLARPAPGGGGSGRKKAR